MVGTSVVHNIIYHLDAMQFTTILSILRTYTLYSHNKRIVGPKIYYACDGYLPKYNIYILCYMKQIIAIYATNKYQYSPCKRTTHVYTVAINYQINEDLRGLLLYNNNNNTQYVYIYRRVSIILSYYIGICVYILIDRLKTVRVVTAIIIMYLHCRHSIIAED